MKQKDWLWCGAVLFALAMFISLQSIQETLYSGIAGGLCAVVSTLLFRCGLRADAQEKSALASQRMEEEQKQLEAQRQAHAEDLERIQIMFDALSGEIRSARESTENEGQAQKERIGALLDCLREWSASDRMQREESVKSICDSILEQHKSLRELLKTQGEESANYYKFMADQPWAEIRELPTALQSIAGQTDNILSAVNSIQSDAEKQFRNALEQLKGDSESLQEKLQTAFAQIANDMREWSASDRMQREESVEYICDSLLEQHKSLRELLKTQGEESANYYKFMVDQPWAEIRDLPTTLQSIADQTDNILSAVDSIQSDAEKQIRNALEQLKRDSESLQEKLQYVCETLDKQGKESRDTMYRMMQSYSNITAQDFEVLTALARDAKV